MGLILSAPQPVEKPPQQIPPGEDYHSLMAEGAQALRDPSQPAAYRERVAAPPRRAPPPRQGPRSGARTLTAVTPW